jgi:hypothetical protein
VSAVTTLRRFVVLAALLFWQGGFTFYAAVVVPVGRTTIGSGPQSIVTRRVTNYLNLSGIIALAPLAWDIWATRDESRRTWRWAMWLGMAATMIALLWLHTQLDALMDPNTGAVQNGEAFYGQHRLYLWICTTQWALAAAYGILSLAAWHMADRREASGKISAGGSGGN